MSVKSDERVFRKAERDHNKGRCTCRSKSGTGMYNPDCSICGCDEHCSKHCRETSPGVWVCPDCDEAESAKGSA